MPRRPAVLSPTALLRRNALYQGVFRGHRGWLTVGAVLYAPRVIKRVFGRNEEIVATETLRRGQFVRLEAIRPPTRRERRAAKRRA